MVEWEHKQSLLSFTHLPPFSFLIFFVFKYKVTLYCTRYKLIFFFGRKKLILKSKFVSPSYLFNHLCATHFIFWFYSLTLKLGNIMKCKISNSQWWFLLALVTFVGSWALIIFVTMWLGRYNMYVYFPLHFVCCVSHLMLLYYTCKIYNNIIHNEYLTCTNRKAPCKYQHYTIAIVWINIFWYMWKNS